MWPLLLYFVLVLLLVSGMLVVSYVLGPAAPRKGYGRSRTKPALYPRDPLASAGPRDFI